MKKPLALLGVSAVVGLGALAFGGPAFAAEEETKTVSLKITDRDDSGFGDPPLWAKDTFDRKVTLVGGPNYFVLEDGKVATYGKSEVEAKAIQETELTQCDMVSTFKLLWKYTATVQDNGTFVTLGGETRSPGNGVALTADAKGTIKGGAQATFYAPAHWCSLDVTRYDGATVAGSQTGSTSEFLAKLFGKSAAKVEKFEMPRWSWTYERCAGTDAAETWVNKAGSAKGETGDITGKLCPTPSATPSATVTPSNPPTSNPPSATTTPTTTTSPVAGLPVTGDSNGKKIAAAGGIAAVLGAIAVVVVRKRRETKFVAE